VLPDTTDPAARAPDDADENHWRSVDPAPDGIAQLPDGPDRDDALAALYAWPARPEPTVRPFVRANMVASLDGVTTFDGRSAGLGNQADEHLFTLLRDLAEVILVGAGTVRAERYGGIRLDAHRAARRARWGLSATPPPIAVVTGRGLDPELPLFTDTETPPIVITTERAAALVPDGVTVITDNDRGMVTVRAPREPRSMSGDDLAAILTALPVRHVIDQQDATS